MQTFTGKEYIKIAAANALGLDQLTWKERIDLGEESLNKPLEVNMEIAKEPFLYAKAWQAHKEALSGKPSGYIMGFDATASGPQIIACLTGCEKTATRTNLINTGKREDIYIYSADYMNLELNEPNLFDRVDIKKPLMTTFYGSKEQPKQLLGEGTRAYEVYYSMLQKEFPGCVTYLELAENAWQPFAEYHLWTLPDDHTSKVLVTESVSKQIEVDEFNHAKFTIITEELCGKRRGISLLANIIQSIDGYIVREMIRLAAKQGFKILCIHDSYWCHPNYMNQLRENYINILSKIAASNLLSNILSEITGKRQRVNKYSSTLPLEILESEYALS